MNSAISPYNILDARNNLSRIIASVESGAEEAVIMRRGKPVARIVAIDEPGSAAIRPNASLVQWLRENPLPERLARTRAELDAIIEENRGPAE